MYDGAVHVFFSYSLQGGALERHVSMGIECATQSCHIRNLVMDGAPPACMYTFKDDSSFRTYVD